MSRLFIGRENELAALGEHYRSNKAELIVIYGRRRIGKTELIKQFVKEKAEVYYLCTKEGLLVQLQRLGKIIAEQIGHTTPLISEPDDFGRFVLSFAKHKRFVLAVDEFPFMLDGDKAAASVWQRLWDEFLVGSKIYLILCGSSIAMMESEVLGVKSPLYGRRTGQLKLLPLKFIETLRFYPRLKIEDAVYLFGLTDGIPFYIAEMDSAAGFFENVERKLLRKDQLLYEEPQLLLKEELREPHLYKQILKAIAGGCTKLTDICNKSGVPQNQITKYLNVLLELNFIEKRVPVTVRKPISKQTLYFVKDNFFLFYFRFVEPNKYLIEQDKQDEVVAKIRPEIDNFIGRFVFERVAWELAADGKLQSMLPKVAFTKIGSWWSRHDEIDLVLLNEESMDIVFCEVKWGRLSARERQAIEYRLREKARSVEWNNSRRKEYFLIFDRRDLETLFKQARQPAQPLRSREKLQTLGKPKAS